MAEVTVSPDALRAKYEEIAELDITIDASTGGKAAGKRAVRNTVKAETEDSWSKPVSQIEKLLGGIEDDRVLAGTLAAFGDVLKNFSERAEAFVSQEVESQKSDVEPVSDAEVSNLLEQRKALVEQYNALRGILELFAATNPEFASALEQIPTVSNRRGTSGGKRPREISMFTLSVDGEVQTDATISSIAASESVETKALKEHLAGQGVDLSKKGLEGKDSFEATLPSGKTLTGTRTHVTAEAA